MGLLKVIGIILIVAVIMSVGILMRFSSTLSIQEEEELHSDRKKAV